MDENLHTDELLMQYLDGEMDEPEKRSFESVLEKDPALREKLFQLKMAVEAVREIGEIERVKSIHAQMMTELLEPKYSTVAPVRTLVRKSLAVAASIIFLLMVAGAWWLSRLTPEKLYGAHWVDAPGPTERGTGEDRAPVRQWYAEKKFRQVEQYARNHSLSSQDSFLVAVSYLQLNEPRLALQWMEPLRRPGSAYSPDAEYYSALAFIKVQNYAAALPLLQQIHKDKSHVYHNLVTGAFIREVKLLQWKKQL